MYSSPAELETGPNPPYRPCRPAFDGPGLILCPHNDRPIATVSAFIKANKIYSPIALQAIRGERKLESMTSSGRVGSRRGRLGLGC